MSTFYSVKVGPDNLLFQKTSGSNTSYYFNVAPLNVDYTLSIPLIGRGAKFYGNIEQQNIVNLLSNFANVTPPPGSAAGTPGQTVTGSETWIDGQLWYDTSGASAANPEAKLLRAYDASKQEWIPVNNVGPASTAPLHPMSGDVWYDINEHQFKIWDATLTPLPTIANPNPGPGLWKKASIPNVQTTAPVEPLIGQMWYDTSTNMLKISDGSNWNTISNFFIGPNPPSNPSLGQLWYDTINYILNVYNGTAWNNIASQSASVTNWAAGLIF